MFQQLPLAALLTPVHLRHQTPFLTDKSLKERRLWKQKLGDTKTDQQSFRQERKNFPERNLSQKMLRRKQMLRAGTERGGRNFKQQVWAGLNGEIHVQTKEIMLINSTVQGC